MKFRIEFFLNVTPLRLAVEENNLKIIKLLLKQSSIRVNPVSFKGTKIASITLPASVNQIEAFAFQDCKNLTTVTLSANITKISKSSFEGCILLQDFTIGSNLAKISKNAFKNCEKLKKFTFNSDGQPLKSLKQIGPNAFEAQIYQE